MLLQSVDLRRFMHLAHNQWLCIMCIDHTMTEAAMYMLSCSSLFCKYVTNPISSHNVKGLCAITLSMY